MFDKTLPPRLPASLDLDNHLQEFPPANFGISYFNRDHLLFLLSRIVEVPASNRSVYENIEDEYVPLSSTILQGVVHEYAKYWKYLKCTGVVEINEKYRPKIFFLEGRCKGYRFASKYLEEPLKEECYSVAFQSVLKKREKRDLKEEFKRLRREYSHLLKWLYPKSGLQIDYGKAISFLELEKVARIKNPDLREKRNKGTDPRNKNDERKDPYFQFELGKINIDKIQNGDFGFTIDTTVFRLHTVLTNIKSRLRNYITYQGQELISIDLRNSQPFLSTKLFDIKFYNNNTNNITHTTTNNTTTNITPMLEFISQYAENEDIGIFKSVVGKSKNEDEDEDLYSYMSKKYEEKGLPNGDRDSIKTGMFEVLFSSNKHTRSKHKKEFNNIFPSVNAVFEKIKSKDKADLAILLQRLESHIFLKVITKKIAKSFPKAPIFTIHDSIVTTAEYVDKVEAIMFKELEKLIGIPPMLKREVWNENDPKLISKQKSYHEALNKIS